MILYVKLLFTLTLTGSVPFCFYLLLKRFCLDKISAAFMYRLLKYCLFCYIFPVFSAKYLLHAWFFRPSEIPFHRYLPLRDQILYTADGYHINPSSGPYRFWGMLWCVLSCGILLGLLVRYLSFRRHAVQTLIPFQKYVGIFPKQMGKHDRCMNIQLFFCDAPVSPFTYGCFHPCIVLSSLVSEQETDLVLRHEMQHIRSGDFCIRMLALFAILLNCLNPIIYLFWKELCEIQELSCDEKIIENMSDSEIAAYGHTLVRLSFVSKSGPSFSMFFSSHNIVFLKRRIFFLTKRKKTHRPLLRQMLWIFFIFSSIFPAFACSPDAVDIRLTSLCQHDIGDSEWIYYDGETLKEEKPFFPPEHCRHEWEPFIAKTHDGILEGGCCVRSRSGMFCSFCGTIQNHTSFWKKDYYDCPHKAASIRLNCPDTLF